MSATLNFPEIVRSNFTFHSSLTVFFPAFNDAPSLPTLLQRTFNVLRAHVPNFEVIVINDGSTDSTGQVLKELEQLYAPHLRVITHPRNLGYGAALRSGFEAATKDYIFYTDGDAQYDPAELVSLLRAASPDVALVNGYKLDRSDPWHRIAIGWLYNHFARWLFRIQLRDIDCDFRLIRRSSFDPSALRSTGGTICVELVRQLELTGQPTVELPVHHYPRLHGRSQFFRLRSLFITFLQLCGVFLNLVLLAESPSPHISRRRITTAVVLVASLAFFAYARSLSLPFIADDFIQIQTARDYAPIDNWSALAADALYRCRATSLFITYWIDSTFGLHPAHYRLAGIVLHMLNSVLLLLFGFWRPIGWRIATLGAAFFAFSQRHSEAVIWHAASPELFVFFFSISAVLCWIAWLESRRAPWLLASALAYVLALLSKESGVAVPALMALAALASRKLRWSSLLPIAAFGLAAIGYFALIYGARDNHLHFSDGTFSLNAPFVEVVLRSAGGLLWPWGFAALALTAYTFRRNIPLPLLFSLGWLALALLPYSFIGYMPRVPSRHTYFASAASAWIVALGFTTFLASPLARKRLWLPPAIALIAVLHEGGYIWTAIHDRYILRADPTERLLKAASESPQQAIPASCFPYSPYIAAYSLKIIYPDRPDLHLDHNPTAARLPNALDLCNSTAEGTRY